MKKSEWAWRAAAVAAAVACVALALRDCQRPRGGGYHPAPADEAWVKKMRAAAAYKDSVEVSQKLAAGLAGLRDSLALRRSEAGRLAALYRDALGSARRRHAGRGDARLDTIVVEREVEVECLPAAYADSLIVAQAGVIEALEAEAARLTGQRDSLVGRLVRERIGRKVEGDSLRAQVWARDARLDEVEKELAATRGKLRRTRWLAALLGAVGTYQAVKGGVR